MDYGPVVFPSHIGKVFHVKIVCLVLMVSVGNYKIEQYIYGKYISKHHKHNTYNFYMENLPNVRRKNHGTIVHSNNSTINNNRNT